MRFKKNQLPKPRIEREGYAGPNNGEHIPEGEDKPTVELGFSPASTLEMMAATLSLLLGKSVLTVGFGLNRIATIADWALLTPQQVEARQSSV